MNHIFDTEAHINCSENKISLILTYIYMYI